MSMKVFSAVTADEYELPVYQTDTGKEMADLLGYRPDSLFSNIRRGCVCKSSGMSVRVIRIMIDEEDD